MTLFRVMRQLDVEAETHGQALEAADEMWKRHDHNELAQHGSQATVGPPASNEVGHR